MRDGRHVDSCAQSIRRSLIPVLRRLCRRKETRDFALPNGRSAQQSGERQTDLALVWTSDNEEPVDLERVKSRWPNAKRVQKLGRNLALVYGMPVKGSRGDVASVSPTEQPGDARKQAERWLAAARQSGDRRREASALADLGASLLNEGDAPAAITALESAVLELSRRLAIVRGRATSSATWGRPRLPLANQPGRDRCLSNRSGLPARPATPSAKSWRSNALESCTATWEISLRRSSTSNRL